MVRVLLAAVFMISAPLGRLSAQCLPCVGGAAVVGGWLDQVRDDPKQWSRDAGGLGTRIASRLGQGAVTTGIIFGGGLIAGRDQGYHLCRCTNTLPRIMHGLAGPMQPVQVIGASAGVSAGINVIREIVR